MMMATAEPAMRREVLVINMGLILASPQAIVNPCGHFCGKAGEPLWAGIRHVDEPVNWTNYPPKSFIFRPK